MLQFNKKKLILFLIFASFFIAIPIIKNKIESSILEKNLSEAYLEFQYLSSPEVLEQKVRKNIDINYINLNISQIYLNLNEFISEKKKNYKNFNQ